MTQNQNMPLHGFRSLEGQPKRNTAALVLMCSFGLAPPIPRSRLADLITLLQWRLFLYSRVVHTANPRHPDKQKGYAKALCEFFNLEASYAIVSSEPSGFFVTCENSYAPLADTIARLPENTQVIVSYADPLGIGYTALERLLIQNNPAQGNSFILNGRGRLIPLSQKNHYLLIRHRLLARYRLLDCLFGLLSIPLAASLALIDGARRHMPLGKKHG